MLGSEMPALSIGSTLTNSPIITFVTVLGAALGHNQKLSAWKRNAFFILKVLKIDSFITVQASGDS